MPGYHMADPKEISVLANTNPEVKEVLVDGYVITTETSIGRDGQFERLEDGTGRMLSEKPWRGLSTKEQEKLLKKFEALDGSKRGWFYSGSGPVVAYLRGGRLVVDVLRDPVSRCWVVWVPDAREAGAPQDISASTNAPLELLLRVPEGSDVVATKPDGTKETLPPGTILSVRRKEN